MTDTTQTQTDAPALPALTPRDLSLVMPEATTVEERVEQIESVRDSDIDSYFADGLDAELLELRKEAGETDETYEGDGDDGDDGSEDAVESGDLTAEDLALLEPYATEADAEARAEIVPDDPSGYELPSVEGYTWTAADEQAAEPYLAAFHELGLPQAAVDGVFAKYGEQVVAMRQQIDANDAASAKAARAELARTWGGQAVLRENVETIKEFLADESRIPGDVAEMIAEARAPDGTRLLNVPSFVEMLHEVASRQSSQTSQPSPAPRLGYVPKAGYANEKAEIMELMQTDIDAYRHRPWKGSNKTASERLLEIERQSGKRK